jgi:hypothetical protein
LNCCYGLLGRQTKQRVLASNGKGSLAGMRIGAVLHPAVCLAFADSTGLEQNASYPSLNRAKGRAPFREFPRPPCEMSTVFAGTDVGWYLRHLGSWALRGCLQVLVATTSYLPIQQSIALLGQLFKLLILLRNAIRKKLGLQSGAAAVSTQLYHENQ